MGSSKRGPTEDMCDRNLVLGAFYGEAADFLDRPSDERLRVVRGLFLSALARERTVPSSRMRA